MQSLPVGIQSFEKLRSNNFLYVDKTKEIYRMVSEAGAYFLSRPRRFGQSLLISTMHELFAGNKQLFEGLYIYDKWDWSRKYPVIRIDWTMVSHKTQEEIEISLKDHLNSLAGMYDITLMSQYAVNCFAELIEKLHDKTGERVVVLVDEYDVPILDIMGKSHEKPENIKTSLHDIYKVLKGSDDHLKFVFLTGVSKFAGLSVFSAMNNLQDISLNDDYATICGITQNELENYFSEHLDATADKMNLTGIDLLDAIRKWYNGYSWNGSISVYNPFSTLLFLKQKVLKNFWFETGTPTFLIDLLKKRNNIENFLQPVRAKENIFSSYDPERLETIPLLFQTGYLTIKDVIPEDGELVYTLEAPNQEVRKSFIQNMFISYTNLTLDKMIKLHEDMNRQIKTCDSKGMEQSLRAMIAQVPHQLHIEKEAYYHSLFLVWLYFMGFKVQGEISTNAGRIDAVWELPDRTVITEMKYHAERPLEKLLNEAIKQIHDRKYYEAYLDKDVILMAIAFSGKEISCRIRQHELDIN
jgi:hypothetical protein